MPASALPRRLGCEITEQVLIRTHASYRTTVPGVYAAGNLAGASLSWELILGV